MSPRRRFGDLAVLDKANRSLASDALAGPPNGLGQSATMSGALAAYGAT